MVTLMPLPLDQAALKQKVAEYLKNNEAAIFKMKKECGELDSYIELITNETTKYAQNVISRGMLEQGAWDLAIRQEVTWAKNR